MQTEKKWNPSQIMQLMLFISKLTPKTHKTEKKETMARESSKNNHVKAVEQAQQTSGKKVWQFMHPLSRNLLFFRWFLELQFLGFECNLFHLNIANNSTNNSLGQSNKFTKHSLHFVTPKTENFIGKKACEIWKFLQTFYRTLRFQQLHARQLFNTKLKPEPNPSSY